MNLRQRKWLKCHFSRARQPDRARHWLEMGRAPPTEQVGPVGCFRCSRGNLELHLRFFPALLLINSSSSELCEIPSRQHSMSVSRRPSCAGSKGSGKATPVKAFQPKCGSSHLCLTENVLYCKKGSPELQRQSKNSESS